MSKELKDLLDQYQEAMKSASTLEIIGQAVLPDNKLMMAVEGLGILGAAALEYCLDPMSTVVDAAIVAGEVAAGCLAVNVLTQPQSKLALSELYRRIRSHKEEKLPATPDKEVHKFDPKLDQKLAELLKQSQEKIKE